MPGKRKLGTTSFGENLRSQLGIEISKKKKKTQLTRKERRKEERASKRPKKIVQKKNVAANIPLETVALKRHSPDAKMPKKIKLAKRKSETSVDHISVSEDPEDAEIARLEKLLGLSKKDKKKGAEKLNKEYEMYEGITGNMGDFLLHLDDLAEGRYAETGELADMSEDSEGEGGHGGHLLDDSEQELTDISGAEEEDDEVGADSGSSDEDDNDVEDEDDGEEEEDGEDDSHIYRPVQGEDIYGRVIDAAGSVGAGGGKYVPPARRAQAQSSGVIDDSAEDVKMLRRLVNGQLNRLSEQSRDSVLKTISDLFRSNSFTTCCHVIKECMLAVCASGSQLMKTLTPLYASLIAALTLGVHADVGSYMLEALAVRLMTTLGDSDKLKGQEADALISDKVAANLLLLIVYLYNLRVVHHRLIMDIMQNLTAESTGLSVLRVELILCVVENCGLSLRSDDPQGLREVIMRVQRAAATSEWASSNSRVQFMSEALLDLKNNKSRRTQTVHAETVTQLRKWLGRVKASKAIHGSGAEARNALTVSLNDLLQAETAGRWWRAGARWGGRPAQEVGAQVNGETSDGLVLGSAMSSATVNDDEQQLFRLAKKMRMNTSVRRSIFVVLMSSRDVSDAFERLSRLDLKGKQDREVMRVICTCCGSEKTYNPFYAELAVVFCNQNRQNRTTLQFVFWDLFTALTRDEEDNGEPKKSLERRAINLARMLSHLVSHFVVSLSVLKTVDMSQLSATMLLFLATFFMGLFSSPMDDASFEGVLDRVATTADCSAVRDTILIFLQRHLVTIPSGLPVDDLKLMKKRRAQTIRTMEAMSVLDIARGLEDDEVVGDPAL